MNHLVATRTLDDVARSNRRCATCHATSFYSVDSCPACGAPFSGDTSAAEVPNSADRQSHVPSGLVEKPRERVRFGLASIFQLIVPLCVILALWPVAPGLTFGVAVLFLIGVAATVRHVCLEASQGRIVPLRKRLQVFLLAMQFLFLAVVIGGSWLFFAGMAAAIAGPLAALLAGLGTLALSFVLGRKLLQNFDSVLLQATATESHDHSSETEIEYLHNSDGN